MLNEFQRMPGLLVCAQLHLWGEGSKEVGKAASKTEYFPVTQPGRTGIEADVDQLSMPFSQVLPAVNHALDGEET
jgi:hypothetical protein